MKKKINFKEKIRRFRKWQEKPYEVAPLSDQEHECATCGTRYQGNFCPRCGQSQRIRRYSFNMAILNFLDVWGLGNRGMFRTIRDLILRPGYMIRDFLSGMQMAYFPPFKMFFILFAFSLLVTHSLNIKGKKLSELNNESSTELASPTLDAQKQPTLILNQEDAKKVDQVNNLMKRTINHVVRSINRYPNLFALLLLLYISGCLYFFFRHCPNIPDLRYSEFFVSLVYINNMYLIYSTVLNFFCLPILASYTLILSLIPLKQLSGYSWWRTISYSFISIFIMIVILILICTLWTIFTVLYAVT